jgi:hypothetical protein
MTKETILHLRHADIPGPGFTRHGAEPLLCGAERYSPWTTVRGAGQIIRTVCGGAGVLWELIRWPDDTAICVACIREASR